MAPVGGTAAVVLAAGAGSRFAGPGHKLATPLEGGTLAGRAVQVALDAAIGPVLVVVGAVGARELALPAGAVVATNERWAEGQAGSLRVAVAWAGAEGLDAVVVGLADQPGLTASAWRAVATSATTPLAVARYGDRRGHPVRLAASTWDLLPTSGDDGARTLLRARPDLVTEVPCEGDPLDLDTVDDLAAWRDAHGPDDDTG